MITDVQISDFSENPTYWYTNPWNNELFMNSYDHEYRYQHATIEKIFISSLCQQNIKIAHKMQACALYIRCVVSYVYGVCVNYDCVAYKYGKHES